MNMSYCRFRNTLDDLNDCYNHLDDTGMNDEEMLARTKLIRLCMSIA